MADGNPNCLGRQGADSVDTLAGGELLVDFSLRGNDAQKVPDEALGPGFPKKTPGGPDSPNK